MVSFDRSDLQNMKFLYFFLILCVIFALLDPDPDPATIINADPCGNPKDKTTIINADPCGNPKDKTCYDSQC